ncbi:MAG: hypothetical protein AAGJ32_08280 [Pseudomonadota bacterium]
MLLFLATALIALSVLLLFAWPLLVVPPAFRADALTSPAARSLAAWFGTAAITACLAPLIILALISSAETVQFVANEFETFSFAL